MNKQLIAIDLGNTTTNIKYLTGESEGVSYYINTAGNSQRIPVIDDEFSDIKEFVLPENPDQVLLWGEGLSELSSTDGIVETRSDGQRYLEKSFRNLLEILLGHVADEVNKVTPLPEGRLRVDLALGLPTDDYDAKRFLQNSDGSVSSIESLNHRGKADASEDNYVNFLKGIHEVKVNGQDFVIEVDNISIVDQPQGTLVYQAMNEYGEYRCPEVMKDHVTIIDFGGLTILTSQYERGRRYSKSDQINDGAYKLATNVATRWNKSELANPRLKITLNHVLTMLRNHDPKDPQYVIRYNQNTEYDVTDIVLDEMNKATQLIIDRLKGLTGWESSDFFFITGGGANLINYEKLNGFLNDYGLQAQKIDNSTYANVRGFHTIGLLNNKDVANTYIEYHYDEKDRSEETEPETSEEDEDPFQNESEA